MNEEAYRIEPSGTNLECTHCGHEKEGWDVIGPDDVALYQTFLLEEDAQELADELNRAYAKGRESAK